MNTIPTQPMSRRDVWLTIALAVAKGEISVPNETLIHDNGAWISYSADRADTYEQAEQAAAHFGAAKDGFSVGGVTRWASPLHAPLSISVWWHGEKEPEPTEPSALAELVVAAIGGAR